jgi:hypothetical protein
MHNARPALAGVAADMRPRQIQMIPQKMHQQRPVFDRAGNQLPVHRQTYSRHETPPVVFYLSR